MRKSVKSKTSKSLHLSGVDRLEIALLFPARSKPLIFCDFGAGAEKSMGPEPSCLNDSGYVSLLRDMSKYESQLDLCFSALGDPTRRMILQRLARGSASVSELAEPHDMALPSFMAHLKKLEAANLITSKKQGRTRICALSADAFAPATDWLSAQSAVWEQRLDRFDAYVNTLLQERNT